MTITQHGTRWPGQQNTVVYSTQGIKKKNFLCAESLSSSQSHVPLFFFTSSWLESEVCSTVYLCAFDVCVVDQENIHITLYSNHVLWMNPILSDVNSDYNNVDLLFWIDVLLVFACNLNSKAASHLFCNLSFSENEPWGHCIFCTLHSSCWMSRLQNIEALPLADFLSELWECVDHIKFICVNNIREYIFIGIVYRIQHW